MIAYGLIGTSRQLVVSVLQSTELDVQTADTLGELADALSDRSIELRLASVRAPALEVLRRAGLFERVKVVPTLDAATHMTKGASP
jgi:MFS superfamily sulfate permease-like transporter